MIDYSLLTEAELVTLLRESDHAAYTENYKRYYYLMFVFAYKKLRDEDQSKDFVQELFTNLWIKRENVSASGNLPAYLYKSLKNKLLDHIIHQKVEVKYLNSLMDYSYLAKSEHADALIRERQLALYIEKQIQSLPKKMRRVFELSKKNNLSNSEIAKMLNTAESNVSQHVNNAIRILRVKLGSFFSLFLF